MFCVQTCEFLLQPWVLRGRAFTGAILNHFTVLLLTRRPEGPSHGEIPWVVKNLIVLRRIYDDCLLLTFVTTWLSHQLGSAGLYCWQPIYSNGTTKRQSVEVGGWVYFTGACMSKVWLAFALVNQRSARQPIRRCKSMLRHRGLLTEDHRRKASISTVKNILKTCGCNGALLSLANRLVVS